MTGCASAHIRVVISVHFVFVSVISECFVPFVPFRKNPARFAKRLPLGEGAAGRRSQWPPWVEGGEFPRPRPPLTQAVYRAIRARVGAGRSPFTPVRVLVLRTFLFFRLFWSWGHFELHLANGGAPATHFCVQALLRTEVLSPSPSYGGSGGAGCCVFVCFLCDILVVIVDNNEICVL